MSRREHLGELTLYQMQEGVRAVIGTLPGHFYTVSRHVIEDWLCNPSTLTIKQFHAALDAARSASTDNDPTLDGF